MKTWIRNFLGIVELTKRLESIEEKQCWISRNLESQGPKLHSISTQIGAITPGLARVIGKLDPMYARDELDPERRKESEDIGEQVMKKLIGEHIERDKYK